MSPTCIEECFRRFLNRTISICRFLSFLESVCVFDIGNAHGYSNNNVRVTFDCSSPDITPGINYIFLFFYSVEKFPFLSSFLFHHHQHLTMMIVMISCLWVNNRVNAILLQKQTVLFFLPIYLCNDAFLSLSEICFGTKRVSLFTYVYKNNTNVLYCRAQCLFIRSSV